MANLNMVEAINLALREEMARDETIIILGEDVGQLGGVFRVTDGLQAEFGPERVVDTPLAEAGIMGAALGLALGGFKPVPEIQFMGFLPPALDQLICHVSRYRNRTRGRHTMPMVVRLPYGAGIHAPEHHSESTEAILAHIPGLKVVIPSTPYDAKGLLISALRDPDPVIFLEPKRIYRAVREEVPSGEYVIALGQAKVIRTGETVTAVAWGSMVREVIRAADLVASQGISVEVIDLRTISPMDDETIVASIRKTGRGVIVHEACRTCGLAAEIIARINEKAFLSLAAPLERVTGFDTIVPLLKLEDHYLPDAFRISRAIQKVVYY
ncbi:MAG: alpha-ketoacid dehydrogenase subunit beta [Deltaproteobacteria bacterium]|nr:alpha-ketoacid dehydrogenase subunit beta [Deltaproteobacteria bacterium]